MMTKRIKAFLFSTTQDQLRFLRFPLGFFTKEIRKLAEFYDLTVAKKVKTYALFQMVIIEVSLCKNLVEFKKENSFIR